MNFFISLWMSSLTRANSLSVQYTANCNKSSHVWELHNRLGYIRNKKLFMSTYKDCVYRDLREVWKAELGKWQLCTRGGQCYLLPKGVNSCHDMHNCTRKCTDVHLTTHRPFSFLLKRKKNWPSRTAMKLHNSYLVAWSTKYVQQK